MLPNGKWEVKDHQNISHIVLHKDKEFFGHENLTQCVDDPMERPYVLSGLLFNIEKQPDQGAWAGYAWLRL